MNKLPKIVKIKFRFHRGNQTGEVANPYEKKSIPDISARVHPRVIHAALGSSMASLDARIDTVSGTTGSPNRMNRYRGVYSTVWTN